MLIFAIDDEPNMLQLLHKAIAQAEPEAEIMDFDTAEELMDAIRSQGRKPDVVFSDIEMPDMDGLALAVEIKNEAPYAKIIFVTGYSQYMGEAYRRHIIGYLMKPVSAAMVREELDAIELLRAAPEPDKLRIQCFGYFEVFWKSEPLIFQRTQTKELLAYLIDREGTVCSSREIALALWENENAEKAENNRIRVLLNDLRTTLRSIGMEKLLIRERRQLAIRCDMVDCDYYHMRNGDPAAVNAYQGEYMKQYGWAELTAARLHFHRR